MAKYSMRIVTGPTLDANGDFATTFSEFQKVLGAQATLDNPGANDLVHKTIVQGISNNEVTTRVQKINTTTASPTSWAAAITSEVADKKFAILAQGI